MKLRISFAMERKYVFIIKEMDKISKALVKFYGTLNSTGLPIGAWLTHKESEIAQLPTSLHLNAC